VTFSKAYAPGEVIAGKYRLTRVIGHGGMGSVWLAHNLPLDMDVAIKLIRRDRTAPEAHGRLLQEARAAARIKHPSIVRVFDFGESEQGDPFIVMELLHGESLRAILNRKGRISVNVAVQTLLPVASALIAAHAKGIVHRDLKPDNILLVSDEAGALIPKVVDFGIAKLLHKDFDGESTLAGEVLGSPDYMSPEQAKGAELVGEPTDVWAFSVLLYEAITGKRPFSGVHYNALVAAILGSDPKPAPELVNCDASLWAIIQKGLAKEPTARWPSMREFGTALATWAAARGVEDDVTGNSIAKQWLTAAAKRLFTVYPETQVEPGAAPRPAAGAPPEVPVNAPLLQDNAPSPGEVETWSKSRLRSNWSRWIVLLVFSLLGVVAYLAIRTMDQETESPAPVSTGAPGVEGADRLDDIAPSASPSGQAAAPSTETPPALSSSASPVVSAKAPQVVKPRRNNVAPPAPKGIRF